MAAEVQADATSDTEAVDRMTIHSSSLNANAHLIELLNGGVWLAEHNQSRTHRGRMIEMLLCTVFYRRSFYIAIDMETSEEFTVENIRIIRPGKGLVPKYYEQILGRRVTRKVQKGTALEWRLVG